MSVQVAAAAAALAALGLRLSAEELADLARQGFVSSEVRAAGTLYKLRYRCGGRQRVRSLGYDAQRAAQVQRSLQQLQAPRQRQLQTQKAKREVMRRLKANKAGVARLFADGEVRFHGLHPRQRRTTKLAMI